MTLKEMLGAILEQQFIQNADIAGKSILIIHIFSPNLFNRVKNIFLQKGAVSCTGYGLFDTESDYTGKLEQLDEKLAGKKFDFIFLTTGLERCEPFHEAAYQLASLLNIGGALLVVAKTPVVRGNVLDSSDYGDIWRYDPESLSQLFSRYGLDAELAAADNDNNFVASILR